MNLDDVDFRVYTDMLNSKTWSVAALLIALGWAEGPETCLL